MSYKFTNTALTGMNFSMDFSRFSIDFLQKSYRRFLLQMTLLSDYMILCKNQQSPSLENMSFNSA